MPDLLRSAFSRGPVRVTVDGITYVLQYESAAQWMLHFTEPHWMLSVLRGVDADSYEQLMDRMETGRAGPLDADRVACTVLAEAGGRAWWESYRLATALREPTLLGAVLGRADPDRLSLAGFLAVVYATVIEGASTTDRMKIEAEIAIPPAGAVLTDDDPDDMAAMVRQMRNLPGVRTG